METSSELLGRPVLIFVHDQWVSPMVMCIGQDRRGREIAGAEMMRSWLVAGLREPVAAALTLLMGVNAVHAADTLPPFKVTGKYMTGLALLVPRGTADTDLKALVLALRRARRENSLDKLIPPTTKGGSRGPYAIVVVHVFDEPEWATSEALERCSKTEPGEFLRELAHPLGLPLRPPVLDDDVSTLDVAQIAQPLAKGFDGIRKHHRALPQEPDAIDLSGGARRG